MDCFENVRSSVPFPTTSLPFLMMAHATIPSIGNPFPKMLYAKRLLMENHFSLPFTINAHTSTATIRCIIQKLNRERPHSFSISSLITSTLTKIVKDQTSTRRLPRSPENNSSSAPLSHSPYLPGIQVSPARASFITASSHIFSA